MILSYNHRHEEKKRSVLIGNLLCWYFSAFSLKSIQIVNAHARFNASCDYFWYLYKGFTRFCESFLEEDKISSISNT